MRPRMIFKIGMSFIIIVAVVMYYIINSKLDDRITSSESEQKLTLSKHERNNEIIVEDKIKNVDRDVGTGDEQSASSQGASDSRSKQHQKQAEESQPSLKSEEKPAPKSQEKLPPPASAAGTGEKEKKQTSSGSESLRLEFTSRKTGGDRAQSMHLSVVACGADRFEETVVLLKSAILFSERHLVFHIFADNELWPKFKTELEFWPEDYQRKMEYNIYTLAFPSSDAADWKKLFKPCASQRLFLPGLLTDVDSLLYVDTDVLFLSPVDAIYEFLQHFNSTQLAALAPEHEDKAVGWYNRFARHPFYGPLGVNSGVMLMNLTRLRRSAWSREMVDNHQKYKLKIPWGDQDLINIYFHFHPDELYVYPCEWNYRPDHCMYMSVCKGAHQDGAYVLHGARRVWHNDKMPAFAAVYKAFKEFRFGEDLQLRLLKTLKQNLAKPQVAQTNCGTVGHIFSKRLEKLVTSSN